MLLKLTQTLVFHFSWWRWYQELILYSRNKVERRSLLVSKCHVYRNNLVRYMYMTEMIIFSYLTDVSYFHLKKKSECCRTWSEQVNNVGFWKGVQMVSAMFSLIFSYFILLSESTLIWKVWRYQRGNQKKDKHYDGHKKKDKQRSTKHYIEN